MCFQHLVHETLPIPNNTFEASIDPQLKLGSPTTKILVPPLLFNQRSQKYIGKAFLSPVLCPYPKPCQPSYLPTKPFTHFEQNPTLPARFLFLGGPILILDSFMTN